MTPTPRQIGMKLKKLRTAKKFSRYELAKRAGISRVYVAKLERGGSNPSVGIIERLAKALGVPVMELLE
jgi:XRE family transcriptional regulator, regulator of sulfur utilization